jgi:beta-galactosidase
MVKEKEKENLENYVSRGGYLIATYFSGIVDENDLVYMGGYPGALKNLMGIWVEELDALNRDQRNFINTAGGTFPCRLICEVIHLEGAVAKASFTEDYYAGRPAVTENRFGDGKAVYLGTQPDREYLEQLFQDYIDEKEISGPVPPRKDLEIMIREKEDRRYLFLLNHSADTVVSEVEGSWKNVLTGEAIQSPVSIKGKDVLILEGQRQ